MEIDAHGPRAMKAPAPRLREDGAGEERTLRTVLRETGGRATVDELYELIDHHAAARFLGLAPATVRGKTRRRELPSVKVGKRCVRYRRIDLIRWSTERMKSARR